MTARTTTSRRRNTKVAKDLVLDTNDDVLDHDTGVTADDVTEEATPARKYMSHANCTHARKGEAGKAARAACRRSIRAWLNAEAEFLAEENVNIAV